MKKRYDNKHPFNTLYNEYYVNIQHKSEVLNIGRDNIPNTDMIFWDKARIQTEILRREGNDKRMYFKLGQPCKCLLLLYEEDVQIIESQFKNYRKSRQNLGYEKPGETDYPKDMLKQKLEAEAHLDVCQGELEILQKKLVEIDSRIVEIEDSHMLEFGLICRGSFHGTRAKSDDLVNVLKEIDGQLLSQLEDGTLWISDERSPFCGMSLPDYRKLAKQWVYEQMNADADKLWQMQEEARKTGQVVPDQLMLRSRRRVSKSSLPKWPEWATNHKQKQTEDTKMRSRT